MKADTLDLTRIFEPTFRYFVPLFQRPYVWEMEKQWQPLWEDLRSVAERLTDSSETNDDVPHFLGAIVIAQPWARGADLSPRTVIDGQQRLATLQLVIAAARTVALASGAETTSKKLDALLRVPDYLAEHPDDRLKFIPTNADRAAFKVALEQDGKDVGSLSPDDSTRILEAYRFFRAEIGSWVADGSDGDGALVKLDALTKALRQLVRVVVISLEPADNAQAIFETLNARGTPLLAADLIKNYLFQRAADAHLRDEDLHRTYWSPFDLKPWRREVGQGRSRRPRIDVFLGHWLTMTTVDEVPWQQLFVKFRAYAEGKRPDVEALLSDLARASKVFDAFDHFPSGSPEALFFYRLDVLETTTVMPVVLWMFGPRGIADPGDRRRALAAIESWLVRRLLCRLTTKNYNQVMLALLKELEGQAVASSATVVSYLGGLAGESQAWPGDDQLLENLRTQPYYTALLRGRLRMVLEAIEAAMRTSLGTPFADWARLTIEHALPQEWQNYWPLPEGVDPLAATIARDSAKHRLGNLTLITQPLNSSLSNAAWVAEPGKPAKREVLNQFNTLMLNKGIIAAETWDDAKIAARGEQLAAIVVHIWPGPLDRAWSYALPAQPAAPPATGRTGEVEVAIQRRVTTEATAERSTAAPRAQVPPSGTLAAPVGEDVWNEILQVRSVPEVGALLASHPDAEARTRRLLADLTVERLIAIADALWNKCRPADMRAEAPDDPRRQAELAWQYLFIGANKTHLGRTGWTGAAVLLDPGKAKGLAAVARLDIGALAAVCWRLVRGPYTRAVPHSGG